MSSKSKAAARKPAQLSRPRGRKSALVIVDVQQDLCGKRACVPVKDSDSIIPVINRLRASHKWEVVVLSQDVHPLGHVSFASSHKTKQGQPQPFSRIYLDSGDAQTVWPDHCVYDTAGAEFHPGLDRTNTDVVVQRGMKKGQDSLSAFFEAGTKSPTGLAAVLKQNEVTDVYVCGVPLQFAAGQTAIDSSMLYNYQTYVVTDATAQLEHGPDEADVMSKLALARVLPVHSSTVIEKLANPQADVTDYFADNSIQALFEELCASLVFEQPENPRKFLIQELERRQAARDSKSIRSPSMFTEHDVDTMFDMLDPLGTKVVKSEHVESALRAIGLTGDFAIPKGKSFTSVQFKRIIEQHMQTSIHL